MSATDDLRLAIADPNATTQRLPHEHIVDWQVRAILAAGWVPPERLRLVRDSVRDVSDERAKAIERVRALCANARKHAGGSFTAHVDVLSIERALGGEPS